MIVGDNPRARAERKILCKELGKVRAQALEIRKSLPSPSAPEVDVFEKYRWRKMLKLVPRSVLKSYFRPLEIEKSDAGPNNSSSPSSDKPSFNLSSSLHQNADLGITQAVQEEDETKLTNSDNVVPPKPFLNFFNPSSPCDDPIPSHGLSLSLLRPSKWNGDRHNISHLSALSRAIPHSCRTLQPSLPARKPILFHFA